MISISKAGIVREVVLDKKSDEVDKLKLYFRNEFTVDGCDFLKIHKPQMREIIDYPTGADSFYAMVYIFCGNTTHFRVMLWDNGIDWNKISDMELFSVLIKGTSIEDTKYLFGDFDFQNLEYFRKPVDIQLNDNRKYFEEILYDPINDYVISEELFYRIRNILRHMFNIFPKVENGISKKRLKREMVEYDRGVALKSQRTSSGSYFYPLISTLLNHPGFKYKKDELDELGIVEFMDSIERISTYEHSIATLHGMMSGFVDGSKIKPEQYNFMKDIVNKPKDIKSELSAAKHDYNSQDAIAKIL